MTTKLDPAKEAARRYLTDANRLELEALQESSRNHPFAARVRATHARRLRRAARAELRPEAAT